MPADSPEIAALKPTARSAVSNGSRLFMGVDGRSRQARRWRDLYRRYMAETGERRPELCRQLATLVLRQEQMDAVMAKGGEVDVGELVRLSGAVGRTMARLGMVTDADDDADNDLAENTRQAIAAARQHLEAAR